jgi:tetratricopeptide (TPR) repeat protein
MWWAVLLALLALQAVSPEVVQHVEAGLRAKKEGRLDVAIAEFQKVTQLEPRFAPAFVNLGAVQIENHDYASAVSALKKALELNPELVGAHELLGYALLAQGYAMEAIPHLQRAQVPGALGIALLQAGRLPEAITQLQAAVAKQPNDLDLLFYLGQACALLSRQAFDTILLTAPDSPRAHQILGENYMAMKRYDDAEREWRAVLQARPDLPGIHQLLGEIYLTLSRYGDAEREFRAETALVPGSAAAAWRLGSALLNQGRVVDARIELERADKLKPGMPETLYDLGKAAELAGDHAAAEHAWLAVIRADGDGSLAAQAHLQLSILYRKQGKAKEADDHLRAFRSLQRRHLPAH